MQKLTLADVARITGGRLVGNPAREISGAKPPAVAGPGDITFVFTAKSLPALTDSKAGAAVVPEGADMPGRDVVHHRNPQAAMAAILEALYPSTPPAAGVHETAVVHPAARLGAGVHVGAHGVVERGTEIADGAIVGAGCFVGEDCVSGAGTRLHPRVVV